MSYKKKCSVVWNDIIERFGYICPECGNCEHFRQHWEIVKDITCDKETGIITYSDTEYANDMHPQITEIECVECGAQAQICKKGVVINVFNHIDNVKSAE